MHISTYVFKAESTLDASANALRSMSFASASLRSAATPHAGATAAQANKERLMNERQKIQTKLEVATGTRRLGHGAYEKAASAFLRAGSSSNLGVWSSKVNNALTTYAIDYNYSANACLHSGCTSIGHRDLRYTLCSRNRFETTNQIPGNKFCLQSLGQV